MCPNRMQKALTRRKRQMAVVVFRPTTPPGLQTVDPGDVGRCLGEQLPGFVKGLVVAEDYDDSWFVLVGEV